MSGEIVKKIIKLAKNKGDHHDMLIEYLNSQVAWNSGLPVPQPFELIYVDGRPGIVFERIYGNTLMEHLHYQLLNNNNDQNNIKKSTYKDIAQITAKILCETHKKSIQNMPSQRDIIINSIKHTKHLTVSESRLVIDILNSIPIKQQLCHGDLNLNNILIRNNEAILIDWMYASMGNPEADLADYILMIRYAELPLKNPIREIMIEELIDEYTKLSDITSEDIDSWVIPIAAHRLSLDILPRVEKKTTYC